MVNLYPKIFEIFESRIQNSEFRIQNPEARIQNPEFPEHKKYC